MRHREPQTYANHRRWVPGYHIGLASFLLFNLVYAVWALVARFALDRVWQLSVAVALCFLYWYARVFATGVQDRVIRTEERLRLERLLPAPLRQRAGEFTVDQLVGLRFASDGELPALAARVLDEKIEDKEEIKRLVQAWRPDDDRI